MYSIQINKNDVKLYEVQLNQRKIKHKLASIEYTKYEVQLKSNNTG